NAPQGNKQGGKSYSATQTKQTGSNTPMLDNFGTDLTKAAEEGKLDPVVGRDEEIRRVTEILCRRKKNNPILIGEPGVGKSAIVEGLAIFIAKKQTSPVLFNKRVIALDMAGIVAGTKYRGQFEERIRTLIKEIENNPDIIIFIDEIHTIVGAGSAPGSMDAANMLKPALSRGRIQCVGATTLNEYRNSIEKDGALERRFQKVMVEPTTAEQTITILHNIKERYEHHHHVKYSDEALTACVKYTDRYVSDRQFPDKAIDALDEVGAKVHLRHAQFPPEIMEMEKMISEADAKKKMAVRNQNFELAASFRDKQAVLQEKLEKLKEQFNNGEYDTYVGITESDVAEVVSTMAGVPVQKLTESEGERLKKMGDLLKNNVVAQDAAIEKMVRAIKRNRMGLRDPKHPIGAFMFLGPTGVGKTYLAKKLAEYMFGSADALIRIDMSEYSESFNTSRLVGAPPGYVGYEEGGQLTEKVRRHPYSIVLLDEIEKAHGNVYNMLLQVLDEGRLTDGNGRLIDFRNTVIIMTSNAGTRQLKEFGRGVGFNAGSFSADMKDSDKEYARSIIQKSLSKQFSPEFLNRLDEIITFDQLDLEAIKKIIDIELKGLVKRIQDMGYNITLTDKAKEFVATKGYDVQFGARPLKRAIQTYIEDGICELMLSGELKEGCTISVGKNPNKEELTFKTTEQQAGLP
ncbi:ATP-dependent Clp protease ATP-binding subunit, partial [Prevotella sp.]